MRVVSGPSHCRRRHRLLDTSQVFCRQSQLKRAERFLELHTGPCANHGNNRRAFCQRPRNRQLRGADALSCWPPSAASR